ncbi:hypothetical protein ABFT23_02980 [Nocardioides sp. C4-1]|uniref:hypothetical protein n=1 Tax=Nocardioides sp. C4-1 TaxID=3151851 RepID=UPI003265D3E3
MSAEMGREAMERRAWGWVAHLRDGGTTPWAAWAGEADRTGRFLPGAQQLELLRRLNVSGLADLDLRRRTDLVERVLTASAPGRGRPDLELVGAVPPVTYGPQPVDPADLSADELLRVATNLLAEDLVAAGVPPVAAPRFNRPWRPFEVAGVPWLAMPVADEMTRRGRRPGGKGVTGFLLATDMATMIELAFVARSFDQGGAAWRDWSASAAAGHRLPPRADLAPMLAAWVKGIGADRVRLVLDLDQLPRLLGTRRPFAPPPVPSADATDLARRVSAPLGLLVLPAERAELLRRRLLPRLLDHPGPPSRLDDDQVAWAREQGERLRRTVAGAAYEVVGSPDRLVPPRRRPPGGEVDDDRVLRLAARLLLEGGAR